MEERGLYIADGIERNEALNMAIDYCIDHDILSEFLRKNRAEVLGMLLEEFDVKKYERTLRSEGREEGKEEGIEQANKLTQILLGQRRLDDLKRATEDREFQRKLFKEFDL